MSETDLGNLIYAFRSSLGINQTEFGHRIRPRRPITQETISKYESGKLLPSRRTWGAIVRLAQRVNFPLASDRLFNSMDKDQHD